MVNFVTSKELMTVMIGKAIMKHLNSSMNTPVSPRIGSIHSITNPKICITSMPRKERRLADAVAVVSSAALVFVAALADSCH